jgi:hypothetical protein
MRIASGDTGREVAFVAVDATDFTTRETGLTTFTVYRMRDGGTPAAMTTPTITEVSSANMPGVYTLLLDEDTTIGAGNDEEEMVFHITHAGMAPVTLTVELFRPKYTEGSTLSAAAINAECDTAISDASLATAANLAVVDANVDLVLADTNELQTNQGNWVTATGFATAAALATVDANLDAVLLDTGTTLPATLSSIEGKIDTVDTVADGIQTDLSNGTDGLGAIKAAVDAIPTSNPSAASIADAVWTEAIADHSGGVGSTAEALDGAGAGGGLDAAGVRAAVGLASANLDTQLGTIDGNVDLVLVDTDTTIPGLIGGLNNFDPATDTVDVGAINGSAEAAADLALSAATIVSGSAASGTLSTTAMTTNLTEVTDDHYNGRIIIWTSGVLKDQATNITDYDGASKLLTFTAVTEAPTAGDTFVIV